MTIEETIYRKRLRRTKIDARDSLTPEQREKSSRQAVERILAFEGFRQAKTVLLYRAIRGELRLEVLESAPEAEGKRFLYPLCVNNTEMVAMLPEGEEAWQPGYFGIMEPVRERSKLIPPEEIDLVLCPCVAFDESCNRMGMGAGFYDRYLVQCTNAVIATVAFEVQKVPDLPTAPWDRPMDLVFTEEKTYFRHKSGRC